MFFSVKSKSHFSISNSICIPPARCKKCGRNASHVWLFQNFHMITNSLNISKQKSHHTSEEEYNVLTVSKSASVTIITLTLFNVIIQTIFSILPLNYTNFWLVSQNMSTLSIVAHGFDNILDLVHLPLAHSTALMLTYGRFFVVSPMCLPGCWDKVATTIRCLCT